MPTGKWKKSWTTSLRNSSTGLRSSQRFKPTNNMLRSASWPLLEMPVGFSLLPTPSTNDHPLWPLDSVDVDFKKAMTPKDRISPKAGRTHAPGKSYRPLERFLPPLRPRPKQALDKQMQDLRKSRDAGKTTPGPSAGPSAPVEAAPAPAPSTSASRPAPSRSRSALEVELENQPPDVK